MYNIKYKSAVIGTYKNLKEAQVYLDAYMKDHLKAYISNNFPRGGDIADYVLDMRKHYAIEAV